MKKEEEIYSQLYRLLDPLVSECILNRIRFEAIRNTLVKKGICADHDIGAEIKRLAETHSQEFTKSLVIKVMQGIESLKH